MKLDFQGNPCQSNSSRGAREDGLLVSVTFLAQDCPGVCSNQEQSYKRMASFTTPPEDQYECVTRYVKSKAVIKWQISDVSARDTHGERLRSSSFVVGRGPRRTSWIVLCNFGTQNYEDYVSAHVKLITRVGGIVCVVSVRVFARVCQCVRLRACLCVFARVFVRVCARVSLRVF